MWCDCVALFAIVSFLDFHGIAQLRLLFDSVVFHSHDH